MSREEVESNGEKDRKWPVWAEGGNGLRYWSLTWNSGSITTQHLVKMSSWPEEVGVSSHTDVECGRFSSQVSVTHVHILIFDPSSGQLSPPKTFMAVAGLPQKPRFSISWLASSIAVRSFSSSDSIQKPVTSSNWVPVCETMATVSGLQRQLHQQRSLWLLMALLSSLSIYSNRIYGQPVMCCRCSGLKIFKGELNRPDLRLRGAYDVVEAFRK